MAKKSSVQRKGNSLRYNVSSSAYDYKYNQPYTTQNEEEKEKFSSYKVQEELRRTKAIEAARKRKIKEEREQLIKARIAVKRDRKNKVLCYILAFYIVGIGVFTLNQFDKNNLIKKDIYDKQAIIKAQEESIQEAKMLVANSVDIYQIEKMAKEELGMKLPSSNQLVYITLPRNKSYIEYDTIENSRVNATNSEITINSNSLAVKDNSQ